MTRPGHKDFETYKGSKRYSEKRLKKLIGRKTMRALSFRMPAVSAVDSRKELAL